MPNLRKSDCSSPLADGYDASICMDSDEYCALLENGIDSKCFETSILELWGYDNSTIQALDRDDILDALNQDSPMR